MLKKSRIGSNPLPLPTPYSPLPTPNSELRTPNSLIVLYVVKIGLNTYCEYTQPETNPQLPTAAEETGINQSPRVK